MRGEIGGESQEQDESLSRFLNGVEFARTFNSVTVEAGPAFAGAMKVSPSLLTGLIVTARLILEQALHLSCGVAMFIYP